jgi:acylphosphatase
MTETSETTGTQRYIVHFEGTVQGVGFRFTTQRVAANYEVAGWVQNLPDGRVKLVAEGRSSELSAFLSEIRERMARYIERDEVETAEATGEFGDPAGDGTFQVR